MENESGQEVKNNFDKFKEASDDAPASYIRSYGDQLPVRTVKRMGVQTAHVPNSCLALP